MTLGKLKQIFEEHNSPDDAILMNDSGGECYAAGMNCIYYNKEKNIVMFTQGDDYYNPKYHNSRTIEYYKGYVVLYVGETVWLMK